MLRPGKRGRRFAAVLAAVATCSLTFAAASWGVAQTIVAGDDFYTAGSYTMDQGDVVPFQNSGVNQHDVTARLNGADGGPLFYNDQIGTGSANVKGTQYLTAGSYQFFCSVHPLSMAGTLVVSGSGTPVARPQVSLKAPKGKVSKVAKKGKLQVTVTAVTAASGVTLQAKLGKAVIGSQSGISLAAGASKKVTLKLTKSGKSKLSKKKKATVTITGVAEFGIPASAKATLK